MSDNFGLNNKVSLLNNKKDELTALKASKELSDALYKASKANSSEANSSIKLEQDLQKLQKLNKTAKSKIALKDLDPSYKDSGFGDIKDLSEALNKKNLLVSYAFKPLEVATPIKVTEEIEAKPITKDIKKVDIKLEKPKSYPLLDDIEDSIKKIRLEGVKKYINPVGALRVVDNLNKEDKLSKETNNALNPLDVVKALANSKIDKKDLAKYQNTLFYLRDNTRDIVAKKLLEEGKFNKLQKHLSEYSNPTNAMKQALANMETFSSTKQLRNLPQSLLNPKEGYELFRKQFIAHNKAGFTDFKVQKIDGEQRAVGYKDGKKYILDDTLINSMFRTMYETPFESIMTLGGLSKLIPNKFIATATGIAGGIGRAIDYKINEAQTGLSEKGEWWKQGVEAALTNAAAVKLGDKVVAPAISFGLKTTAKTALNTPKYALSASKFAISPIDTLTQAYNAKATKRASDYIRSMSKAEENSEVLGRNANFIKVDTDTIYKNNGKHIKNKKESAQTAKESASLLQLAEDDPRLFKSVQQTLSSDPHLAKKVRKEATSRATQINNLNVPTLAKKELQDLLNTEANRINDLYKVLKTQAGDTLKPIDSKVYKDIDDILDYQKTIYENNFNKQGKNALENIKARFFNKENTKNLTNYIEFEQLLSNDLRSLVKSGDISPHVMGEVLKAKNLLEEGFKKSYEGNKAATKYFETKAEKAELEGIKQLDAINELLKAKNVKEFESTTKKSFEENLEDINKAFSYVEKLGKGSREKLEGSVLKKLIALNTHGNKEFSYTDFVR
ncbi:hypothetical protein, partial [Helicobacter sp. 11S02629-2]|uniref:hypothetical protein n=1 Tax=Helicobacter sp. 11S02629-2 TaxID=1476195 RepID=UPI00117A5E38